MSPQAETTTPRPRVEGDREAEILDAALEVLAEVGYDRLTMDAVAPAGARPPRRRSTAAGTARSASSSTRCTTATSTSARHVAVDTGSLREDLLQAFCGAGGLTDKPEGRHLRCDPHRDRPATPTSPTAFRREVLAPKLAATSGALFERPRPAVRSAPRSTSSSSPLPWPASCCTASSSWVRPPRRTSSRPSSTRSSCRPLPAAPDRLLTPREGTTPSLTSRPARPPSTRPPRPRGEQEPRLGARPHLGGGS